MAGFLKPIPQRSEYPFDPDNPVPNGVQLTPAELRAKYYKVIDSNARYYTGDPRLLRDRDSEVDPALTKHFKQYRADGMEVVDSTNRHLIDEICRGRWCCCRSLLALSASCATNNRCNRYVCGNRYVCVVLRMRKDGEQTRSERSRSRKAG